MFKKVIGIRTNTWSNLEESLYNKLHQVFSPEQIFVIVDETKSRVETPSHIQKISWDKEFIKSRKLLDYNHFNKGIGWLCGDYFYYVFKEQVKSEYYWLIEPDVAFTFEHLNDFFSVFEDRDEDALLTNFGLRLLGNYWFKSADLIAKGGWTYGCSFPLSRISAKAIDVCLQERQILSQLYTEKKAFSFKDNPIDVHFPNDEVLVATTLMRDGFKVKSFNDFFPEAFEYFGYHQWFSIPQKDELRPRNNIIHPVRDISMIADKLSNEIISDMVNSHYLDYTMVNLDNIEFVASQVGTRISQYIESTLYKQMRSLIAIDDVKTVIKNEIKKLPIPMKVWIWEKNTVVLETTLNSNTLTLDFCIDGNNLTCYAFEKTSQSSDWAQKFVAFYPSLQLNGKKGKLFESSLENKNASNEQIKRAVDVFYSLIEETYFR